MDIDFLRSKRRLMKKRLTRQRSAMGSAFSETEAAHASYKKEFGDIAGAQTAFDEAKTAGLKTFGKTGTGQRLNEIGKRYGIENFSQHAGSGNVTRFASDLRKKLHERKNTASMYGGKWKQAQASARLLEGYLRGGDKEGIGGQLARRHANILGLDTTHVSFKGGRAYKSRQGKRVWKGSILRWQWDPFKNWEEDVTGRYSADAIQGKLKDLHKNLGFTQVEEDLGFLSGRTTDYKGKQNYVNSFVVSQDFKDYKTSLDPTRNQLIKEQSESGQAFATFKEKEGIFTSAKERFDKTTADFTKLTGRIKKFERLGLGQEIKSNKYRKVQAGAGSYL